MYKLCKVWKLFSLASRQTVYIVVSKTSKLKTSKRLGLGLKLGTILGILSLCWVEVGMGLRLRLVLGLGLGLWLFGVGDIDVMVGVVN